MLPASRHTVCGAWNGRWPMRANARRGRGRVWRVAARAEATKAGTLLPDHL